MKFAALGRTHWLFEAIKKCASGGHDPVFIGTCPAAPEYQVTEHDFSNLADQYGCPYFCDTRINRSEFRNQMEESEAEVAISINWTSLIGPEVLSTFKHGIINAHAGDLPRYRGNACPNWAILMGEPSVVLSLHTMVADLDAGPILHQRAIDLTDETYISDIYRFFDHIIPEMMCEVLDNMENGTQEVRAQSDDPADSLRCLPRRPADGLIDWTESATQITRLVRASAEPFAGAFTHLESDRLTVWRARAETLSHDVLGIPGQVIERRPDGDIVVLSRNGVVVVQEVETSDGWRGRPGEIIGSTRTRLGLNATLEVERLRAEMASLTSELRRKQAEQELTEEWDR